jgi:hypothetical protein
MQFAIATLLGVGMAHAEIAEALHISVSNVRSHMRYAARKLPGDLPMEAKLVAWVRGATLDVLEGTTLRGEFMRDAQRGRIVSATPEIVRLG